MKNTKKILFLCGLLAVVATGAGCTSLRQLLSKPEPTGTPSPTPTKSVDYWVTATPSATPTLSSVLWETPTPKPTPTAEIYVPETPTPKPTKAPTNTPVPTKEPTKAPTSAPTKAPTKTPTPKPTEKPSGSPTAQSLLNSLYEVYPNLMSTTSIMVDLYRNESDGSVTNMYYTKYTNEESDDNILHQSNDIWTTTATNDKYEYNETYYVIDSSKVTSYSNAYENEEHWVKKTLAADAVGKGVTVLSKSGILGFSNPKIVKSDATNGYVIEMDCAVDLSAIIKTLTNGSYSKTFKKTIKATAEFDYKTLQPTRFYTEASEVTVSTDLVLHDFQYLVDNILPNPSAIEVPANALKAK